MEESTVSIVKDSFRKVLPIAEQAGLMFYGRLFETFPQVRPMFAEDIEPQAKKLVQMLAIVVNGLDRIDAILPAVRQLAVRHNDYGVEDEHYEAVGQTLIWTLRQGLGEAFTADVEKAWTDAYGTLSSVMIEAARSPSAA